jgi:hypothetical protein
MSRCFRMLHVSRCFRMLHVSRCFRMLHVSRCFRMLRVSRCFRMLRVSPCVPPSRLANAASVRPTYVLWDQLLGGHMTATDASAGDAGWRCDQTRRGSCWSVPLTRPVSLPLVPCVRSARTRVHRATDHRCGRAGTTVYMTFRNPRTDETYSVTVLRHVARARNVTSPPPAGGAAVGGSAPPSRPVSVLLCVGSAHGSVEDVVLE